MTPNCHLNYEDDYCDDEDDDYECKEAKEASYEKENLGLLDYSYLNNACTLLLLARFMIIYNKIHPDVFFSIFKEL